MGKLEVDLDEMAAPIRNMFSDSMFGVKKEKKEEKEEKEPETLEEIGEEEE